MQLQSLHLPIHPAIALLHRVIEFEISSQPNGTRGPCEPRYGAPKSRLLG